MQDIEKINTGGKSPIRVLKGVEVNLMPDGKFDTELNKKVFGFEVDVPLGGTTEIVLTYELPDEITQENYEIIYQEQSGADRKFIQK